MDVRKCIKDNYFSLTMDIHNYTQLELHMAIHD